VTEKPNLSLLSRSPECGFSSMQKPISLALEGTVRLGSIRMAAIVDKPERQHAFMDVMRDFASEILKEVIGVRPAWPNPPHAAPEHERAGNS
jgi:hypothetical protein